MKDMFRRDLKGFYKATHEKLYHWEHLLSHCEREITKIKALVLWIIHTSAIIVHYRVSAFSKLLQKNTENNLF